MTDLFITSFDAIVMAGLTCLVLHELIDVAAPRLFAGLRRH